MTITISLPGVLKVKVDLKFYKFVSFFQDILIHPSFFKK